MVGNKLLVPILLLLYVLGWFLAMAGLAAVQDKASSFALSLQWFILFLQLAVIVAIPVLSLMGKINSVKLFMIHMLAILSTLWLIFANDGYQAVRGGDGGISDARYNTAIAGACVLFATNLLAALMIELDSTSAAETVIPAPSGGKVDGAPPPPAPATAV